MFTTRRLPARDTCLGDVSEPRHGYRLTAIGRRPHENVIHSGRSPRAELFARLRMTPLSSPHPASTGVPSMPSSEFRGRGQQRSLSRDRQPSSARHGAGAPARATSTVASDGRAQAIMRATRGAGERDEARTHCHPSLTLPVEGRESFARWCESSLRWIIRCPRGGHKERRPRPVRLRMM
jgi:hypothetical protein